MGQLDDYIVAQVTPMLQPGESIGFFGAAENYPRYNPLGNPVGNPRILLVAVTEKRLFLLESEGSGMMGGGPPKPMHSSVEVWDFAAVRSVSYKWYGGLHKAHGLIMSPHDGLGPLQGKGRRIDIKREIEGCDAQANLCDQFPAWLQGQVEAQGFGPPPPPEQPTAAAMVAAGGGAVTPAGGGNAHYQLMMEVLQPMLAEGETIRVYGLAQHAVRWALGLLINGVRKYFYVVLTDRNLYLIRVKGGVSFGFFFRLRWLLWPPNLLFRYYAKPKLKDVRQIPLEQISNAWVRDSMAAAGGLLDKLIVKLLGLRGTRIELQGDKPVDLIIDNIEMAFPEAQKGLYSVTREIRQLKELPPPPAGGLP